MSTFVSGLPGDSPQEPTLEEALKKLEAGVKGYSKPRTVGQQALEARRYPERDNALDQYWSIYTKQEMLDKRLAEFPLMDTSKAKQIPLPLPLPSKAA